MSAEEDAVVFAYGTLRRGDCRYGIGSFVEMVHEEAYINGFHLIDLGACPGVVRGDGRVRGEIHRYVNLETLDRIEGYDPSRPEHSLYVREVVSVETPEGPTEAVVYIFNRTWDPRARNLPIIESGDWLEHCAHESRR